MIKLHFLDIIYLLKIWRTISSHLILQVLKHKHSWIYQKWKRFWHSLEKDCRLKTSSCKFLYSNIFRGDFFINPSSKNYQPNFKNYKKIHNFWDFLYTNFLCTRYCSNYEQQMKVNGCIGNWFYGIWASYKATHFIIIFFDASLHLRTWRWYRKLDF